MAAGLTQEVEELVVELAEQGARDPSTCFDQQYAICQVEIVHDEKLPDLIACNVECCFELIMHFLERAVTVDIKLGGTYAVYPLLLLLRS